MTTQQIKNYSTWALRGDSEASWYESYANRSIFELGDAASILANVQPEYPGNLDAGCLAEISQWVETLKANVHELLAQSGYNEKEPLHHRLSHQKLRAWCTKIDKAWPIPASRLKEIEQQLEVERGLRLAAEHRADPTMSPFTPPVLEWHQPEEVYRHLDWLTESQALDWMSRISGRDVDIYCLLSMVQAEVCNAFLDCRAVKGFTYPDEGEHEHRAVYGLGICQVMNALHAEGSPIYLTGPAMHVDMHGYQEIKPKRSWWIDDTESYDLLFKPSDIEQAGGMIEEGGRWSNHKQIAELELNPRKEFSPEHSGAELAHLLGGLEISIDNQHDRIRYCVRFEDGRLLAELGSDLKPLGFVAASDSAQHAEHDSTEDAPTHTDEAYEAELSRLKALVVTQTEMLESLRQFNDPEIPEPPAGTTFPYSTKGLEALRAVALKHWAGYTPDKRQPTQKDIGYAICEELGLEYQKTNEPPRKAKELATIIRPDELPDA